MFGSESDRSTRLGRCGATSAPPPSTPSRRTPARAGRRAPFPSRSGDRGWSSPAPHRGALAGRLRRGRAARRPVHGRVRGHRWRAWIGTGRSRYRQPTHRRAEQRGHGRPCVRSHLANGQWHRTATTHCSPSIARPAATASIPTTTSRSVPSYAASSAAYTCARSRSALMALPCRTGLRPASRVRPTSARSAAAAPGRNHRPPPPMVQPRIEPVPTTAAQTRRRGRAAPGARAGQHSCLTPTRVRTFDRAPGSRRAVPRSGPRIRTGTPVDGAASLRPSSDGFPTSATPPAGGARRTSPRRSTGRRDRPANVATLPVGVERNTIRTSWVSAMLCNRSSRPRT